MQSKRKVVGEAGIETSQLYSNMILEKSVVMTSNLPSSVNAASILPFPETVIFATLPTPVPNRCTPSSSTMSTPSSSATPSSTSTFPDIVYCGSITAIQRGASKSPASARRHERGSDRSGTQNSLFSSVLHTTPPPQKTHSATLSSKHSFPMENCAPTGSARTS